MFRVVLGTVILVVLLFWSVSLAVLPNYVWLIKGLTKKQPEPESPIEYVVALVPRNLAKFKIEHLESDCFFYIDGQRISYLSILIDIIFDAFRLDSFELDKVASKQLVLRFKEQGCSLNVHHPANGLAPIHSALLSGYLDHDYLIRLIELGADVNLPIKHADFHSHGGRTGLELIRLIVANNRSTHPAYFKRLLLELEARNQSLSRVEASRLD
ncbi:hypothetical protein [Pseudoalteromonas sp. McH1-42]|uniref:hypothetical protein n=1 Tax=Pseudoalteromonas sp. McH1-42 TaxID=2917752 RepID=UPI001EF66385|nr:hypothetical protein [Pseudoalteromonas sp. McH1-42]MCG7563286.1 hypothetical protein [Pseudoalteromonas sp. McH1-42]